MVVRSTTTIKTKATVAGSAAVGIGHSMAAEVEAAAWRRLCGEGGGSVAAGWLWGAARQQGVGDSLAAAVAAAANVLMQPLAS